jgi:glycosyltransferase involved in cell wall biosynthesis
MTEPSIAVIVPNYNDARYLPRCIRSVLDQEVRPDELIVVDDKSTDNSVHLIRSLIVNDPIAQLVENPVNLGTNKAIAEGLRRLRSDYVVFLAANDFVMPGIFARAKACLARSPGAGLWSAMAWLVDEENRAIRLHPSAVVALKDTYLPPDRCVKLAWLLGNWFLGTTATYHRDTLLAAGGFDPAYGAQADMFAALVVSSMKGAVFTPEPFAAIRIHRGSYSSRALKDVAGLENMLAALGVHGPALAPRLFSAPFLERNALRFRFASLRATDGAALPAIAARVEGWRRVALLWMNKFVPATLRRPRLAFAFLILRPFDVLPTFWNRCLGWVVVRSRLLLRGGTTITVPRDQ